MANELCTLTKKLKKQLTLFMKMYFENDPPKSLQDHMFFNKMKSETEPLYEDLELWKKKTLSFIKHNSSRVFPHQIESTKENYHLVIMHSYYIDEREKRYMELQYSIQYVFDILLEDIKMIQKEENFV